MYMSPDNKMITYEIPPSFIDSAGHLKKFQIEMKQFVSDQTKRVAIVNAPTASGKTYGFRLMGEKGKTTLIVFPNNLLSRETVEAFKLYSADGVALLNAFSINALKNEKKNQGFHDFTIRKAIGLILENKKFVITNPTLLYNMLRNHYSEKHKEDMLSELIKNNLTTVIFDEFHIYSRDQALMVLASTLLLRKDIKLIFASATIPDYLPNLLKELYGEDQLCEIRVKRSSEGGENSALLQGKLSLHLFNGSAVEFVRSNSFLFRTGKWFLILDSIKNIHEAKSELSAHIPNSDIMVVSAYDDPSYEGYANIKNGMISKRIIIGSNIVEQGINPPVDYTNFLIEPGYSPESIIQRSGRIGRGTFVVSNLYVAIHTVTFPDQIESMDDFFAFTNNFKYRYEPCPLLRDIGAYLWFMIDRLTGNAKESVFQNLKNDKRNASVLVSCFGTKKLDRNLNDKAWVYANIRYVKELGKIVEWWKYYKESISRFIPSQNEINVLDTSDDFKEFGGLSTKYSELWLKKNKEVVEVEDGFWIVKDFLNKPDFDFPVCVSGLPFDPKVKMKYGNIYFNARKEIINRFKLFYGNFFALPDEMKETFEALGNCIYATAGMERLRLELI